MLINLRKTMNRIKFFAGVFLVIFSMSSCAEETVDTVGKVKVDISHKAGSTPLILGSYEYTNALGQPFFIEKFKYYISNITLVKENGEEYLVPESYFLIDASDENTNKLEMTGIPSGKYTGIRYIIGVDSTRNTSGAQTGALDPLNGMFWTWDSGYIFLKLEGSSPNSMGNNQSLVYHIGGFKGANNSIRTLAFSFDHPVEVSETITPELHFVTDVLKIFEGPQTIDFSQLFFCMGGPNAPVIADNYKDMMELDHIH